MAKKKEEKKEAKATHKDIKILCYNCAGKYGLPYNYGQKVNMEIKQAEEMIEAGDA